ncbi:hypothetical protein OG871_05835 [Kitasatospora sp. NBC_00374]
MSRQDFHSAGRIKRTPVTDHAGRLVGVVRRTALLQAPVRDDEFRLPP